MDYSETQGHNESAHAGACVHNSQVGEKKDTKHTRGGSFMLCMMNWGLRGVHEDGLIIRKNITGKLGVQLIPLTVTQSPQSRHLDFWGQT